MSASQPVLLTGGSGLLALNWAVARRGRDSIVLGMHSREVVLAGTGSRRVSLNSIAEVLAALDTIEPRLVMHAAGLTDIEACDANPEVARAVNVGVAANVAAACAARGVPLVHISTDHLVSGDDALVDETAPPAPRNVYARTKADAEQRVLDACPGALVVRTNFYGWGTSYRRSFSEQVVHTLREGRPITLFTDVFYTPIIAEALVEAVHDLVDRKASGILHVVGDERLSKHEFGQRLARQFALDETLIRPGHLTDQPSLVRRPQDMSLSNAKARRLLGRPLGGVDPHLARLQQQERDGQAKELQSL